MRQINCAHTEQQQKFYRHHKTLYILAYFITHNLRGVCITSTLD